MITLATLEQTCFACPSQWEGTTTDGLGVYIRYRHGILTAGVALSVDSAVLMGGNLAAMTIGDSYDGVMSTDEMLTRLKAVLEVA